MTRVFLSHSGRDTRAAIALKRWLAGNDQTLAADIFLDVDADTGIPTGVKWREALQAANSRCEAVICLLSPGWSASRECRREYDTAMELHKRMFCARLMPSAGDDLTSEWQRCDLFGSGPTTSIDLGDRSPPVTFASDGLHRLLKGVRGAGITADSFGWPPQLDPDRAPYRGWEPLAEVDAAVFFGRDAEIVLGLDALRGMRATAVTSLFVVLGPSGAGKSSFLRAGLLPRLRRDDRRFLPLEVVRPEGAVLIGRSGLAQSIHTTRMRLGLRTPGLDEIAAACLADHKRVHRLLRECQQSAEARLLDRDPESTPPTIVLGLDQAEELFGADAGPQAGTFLDLIADLAKRSSELDLIVATTIRTDRYEAMQTASALAGLQTVTFNDLKPMPDNLFKDVIAGPAARATQAGRRLDLDPELVKRLLADCNESADALPILSLTLARLYDQHCASGRLTREHYEAMGGMRCVVQTEIDDVLSAQPDLRHEQLGWLRAAFIPWLATINPDNDQPMRRFARYADLPARSRPLIDALVAKRLLVKDTRPSGEVVVEVALESLLRQWGELDGWLREQRHNLKAADDMERAAEGWRLSNHSSDWLLEGARLADAEALAATREFGQRLESVADYLVASRYRENGRRAAAEEQRRAELDNARERQSTAEAHAEVLRKRSKVLRRVLAATVVVAVIAVAGAIATTVGIQRATTARNEANRNFRDATSVRLVSEAQGMLADTRPGSDVRAFQQLVAARKLANLPNDGAIYSAVVKEQTTRKIIEVPDPTTSVAVSPDGQRIASGGADGLVRLWSIDSGQQIGGPMIGHQAPIQSVTFSPDGKLVASGSVDRTIRLWDSDTGKPVRTPLVGSADRVFDVAFSPDGSRIASGGNDNMVRIWDVATGQQVGPPLAGHQSTVVSVAYSPDGRLVASGSADKSIRLWDTESGQPVGDPFTADQAEVVSVAFSPDGARLVTGGGKGTLQWWDVATRAPIGTPLQAHTKSVATVEFSRDGSRLVTSSLDATVRMWDASTGQPIGAPMTGHEGEVDAVAFTPDGHRLVSGSVDRTIRIWNADIVPPLLSAGPVFTAVFSPDGRTIASCGADRMITIWDAGTGTVIRRLAGHDGGVDTVAFSPDGRLLASGGTDQTVRLWDASTGDPVGEPLRGHEREVFKVVFSPDGRMVASSAADGTVRLWEVGTRQPIGQPMRGTAALVVSLAFSPDGEELVSGGSDSLLQMWSVRTRQPIGAPMRGHNSTDFVMSVAFSPDGHRIVSGSGDRTVRLWDADSLQPVGDPLTGHQNRVTSVAFSPDGSMIASAGADNEVRLWDARTGRPVGDPLIGHTDGVYSVAFSPDGTRLVSSGQDAAIRIWPATSDPQDLCDKLSANMSEDEWRQWVSPDIGYDPPCPGLPKLADTTG